MSGERPYRAERGHRRCSAAIPTNREIPTTRTVPLTVRRDEAADAPGADPNAIAATQRGISLRPRLEEKNLHTVESVIDPQPWKCGQRFVGAANSGPSLSAVPLTVVAAERSQRPAASSIRRPFATRCGHQRNFWRNVGRGIGDR
jgi:hypothetical protein